MSSNLSIEQECTIRAQADKLELLFYQSTPAVLINIAIASGLTAILWAHVDHVLLSGWLGILILSTTLRAILFLIYLHVSPQGESILSWERSYYYSLLISSLIWGFGCVLFMTSVNLLHQSIIYCFLVGMAAGAMSVYSAIRNFALSTILSILLPSTIWLLLQDDMTRMILGISGSVFLASSVRAINILSKALHKSFFLNHQLTIAKEQAEYIANTDILTGLNNRGAFSKLAEVQAEYCHRYNHPISVIVLDVDHFKKVNDSRGHHSGDLALQHLAQIIRDSIRHSDICGRIGGEEFAILLPNTDHDGAENIAKKIKTTVEIKHVKTPDGSFNITASFGIATGNTDIGQLMRMADIAMYRAKETGRNKICHYIPQDNLTMKGDEYPAIPT